MAEALIIGAGPGVSASTARKLSQAGYSVTLAARDVTKLDTLCEEIGANAVACDASNPESVTELFEAIPGPLRVVLYNPSMRLRGPITDLDPIAVKKAIEVTAFGAFLAGQAAARRMLSQEPENGCRGTILFTGASAGVKAFPQSATFAMGKFAERGLAQSMARELHPQGIHVAWVNIDGGIASEARPTPEDRPNSMLDPDAIAETYMHLINQHPSTWTEELALRPWVENF